jgi:hypothetical protein
MQGSSELSRGRPSSGFTSRPPPAESCLIWLPRSRSISAAQRAGAAEDVARLLGGAGCFDLARCCQTFVSHKRPFRIALQPPFRIAQPPNKASTYS